MSYVRVAVVMPSLNQAEYIEAAIHSVLALRSPDVMLFVADGASTDGTQAVLARLEAGYAGKLRWRSAPDSGPATAVNFAIQQTSSEFVGWLNADDLYAPNAIARAIATFDSNQDLAMVYGNASWISADGTVIGAYPTLPPAAGIGAFHEGCYICQPSTFLRRDALNSVGLLDSSLRTAFDFELWLRMFKSFTPARIGFVPDCQAFSRLHAATITARMRKRVALEAIEVLARHVGTPGIHWLLTYIDEVCDTYPADTSVLDLQEHVAALIVEASQFLDGFEVARLQDLVGEDARLILAQPGVFIGVHRDGWAGRHFKVRLLRGMNETNRMGVLRLSCVHASPLHDLLSIDVRSDWGGSCFVEIAENGQFELAIEIPESLPAGLHEIHIDTEGCFIPSDCDPESNDSRELAFRVLFVAVES